MRVASQAVPDLTGSGASAPKPLGRPTGWERSWNLVDHWAPYVLLVASTIMSVMSPTQPTGAGAGTVALATLAGAWIAVGYTTAASRRQTWPAHHHIYLAGLLGLAALLMSRDIIFFLFAISGFLHSAALRPLPLVFVGTGATSLLIAYFTWGGLPQDAGAALMFFSLIVVQTAMIGFGVVGSEKLSELSEERRRAVTTMETAVADNQRLQEELVLQARDAGIRDERQRMAREIHDTLAQGMIGVLTQLQAADQVAHDVAAQRRHLDNAAELARHSLGEARRSVQALNPGELERGRLPDILDDLVDDWSALYGVRAESVVTSPQVTLPVPVEVTLLRVAQEALANVARHADATRVGVTLSLLDDQVVLDVRDDGCGFDPTMPRAGASFGLAGMRQRVGGVGGTLTVESHPGAGTAVSASIPVKTLESQDA